MSNMFILCSIHICIYIYTHIQYIQCITVYNSIYLCRCACVAYKYPAPISPAKPPGDAARHEGITCHAQQTLCCPALLFLRGRGSNCHPICKEPSEIKHG